MPQITDPTASYDGTEEDESGGDFISLPMETGDFAAGVSWPHAGVYIYTVTELNAGVTDVTYSQAQYEVTFWVSNCEIGVDEGCSTGLYVSGVGVYIEKDDDGEDVAKTKVDPTPGGGESGFDYSQMIFTNYYVKTNNGDPTKPNEHVLNVSKTVEGEHADLTRLFAFDFTVTKPATGVTTDPIYKAYVVEAGPAGTNVVVTSTANCDETFKPTEGKGPYCEVQSGAQDPIRIYLKHGQAVAFVDFQVGVTYEVVEAAEANYSAQVDVVVNGGSNVNTDNDELDKALSSGENIIGTGKNSAAFTNTRVETTPTGVLLNNLPFIGLIVLGLAAVILVTVSRRGHNHA